MLFFGKCVTGTWCQRKNGLAFFLFLFLNISFLPSLFAATEKATQALDVRVSYIPNDGIFDDTYNAQEFLQEYFSILLEYEELNISYIPSAMNTHSLPAVTSGKDANILAFIAKSPERMFRYKFSQEPIAATDLYLATDVGKNIYFNDISALNGKTVAIFAENSEAKNMLDDFIVKNNITMKYLLYDDYKEYVFSQADFHLVNSFYFMQGKQVVAPVGTQNMYFATLPRYIHLLKALDLAAEKAKMHNAELLEKLYLTHVNKDSYSVRHILDAQEIKIMENPRNVAQVGFLDKHFPIQYVDENGEPAGISIGVLNLFRQMYDNPTELIPYALHSGVDITQFDMTFAILGHKEVKKEHFYTSKTYASMPMVLFERHKDVDTTQKNVMGMLDYSVLDHDEVQKQFPQWELKIFNDISEVTAAYTEERIHAILLTQAGAENAITVLGMSENKVVPTSLVLPLKFYLSKKYPIEALNVLNAYIDKLNPVAVQGVILAAENAMRPPSTFQGLMREYQLPVLGASILLVACIFFAHAWRSRSEKSKLYAIINTDLMTGLSTKKYAFEILERTLKRAKPGEYMLLCIDVDRFSLLNQVYGKGKADSVLLFLANILKKKYIDREKGLCMARLRDDIFLIFMKTRPLTEPYDTPEFILDMADGVKEILQSNYTISLSRGCYVVDDVQLPVDTIVDYCNMARLKGKKEHGISSSIFTEQMKHEIDAQKQIIYRMEHGIANSEFVLHFQPQVSLQNNRVCGAEVLVRWHPTQGPAIYPADFISVFESNAFIAKLDMYVFEKTCKFIRDHKHKYQLPPLAMNLSGISVLHDETYSRMEHYMRYYAIEPHEVEIEITESALVAESDSFIKAIDSLGALGFKIAIDDFGTGVSSLHRLSSLRVDVVKLDKAFLDDKLVHKKGVMLVASIITMLHRLGMQVIAEGVESQKHVYILKKLQCDIAQGYYFSKPLPQDVFVNKLPIKSVHISKVENEITMQQ